MGEQQTLQVSFERFTERFLEELREKTGFVQSDVRAEGSLRHDLGNQSLSVYELIGCFQRALSEKKIPKEAEPEMPLAFVSRVARTGQPVEMVGRDVQKGRFGKLPPNFTKADTPQEEKRLAESGYTYVADMDELIVAEMRRELERGY